MKIAIEKQNDETAIRLDGETAEILTALESVVADMYIRAIDQENLSPEKFAEMFSHNVCSYIYLKKILGVIKGEKDTNERTEEDAHDPDSPLELLKKLFEVL